jgi:integrase
MTKSSVSRHQSKPKKPYPEFPLSIHQSGRWFKKHKGRFYYFGPVDDWQSALDKYEREWPYIIQGKTAPPSGSEHGATVADVCNSFLNMKRPLLDSGELSHRTFEDYFLICEKIVVTFGKNRIASDLRPEDFGNLRSEFASIHGPHRLTKDITVTKMVFRHGHEVRLLENPVLYGGGLFDKPSRKSIRRARNAAGPKMFEADEIRLVLEAADSIMRSMVLLGINFGFGNTDVATLTQTAVDFDGGWIDFSRWKTEIHRRIPMWPETSEALRIAITKRPKPTDNADSDLCFLTKHGQRWVRTQPKKNSDRMTALDALGQKFRKFLDSLDINGRRNFYGFRHSFQTIAEECRDLSAVKSVMGHSDDFNMSGQYRERISDERLRAVADVVRAWLWPEKASADSVE